MGPERPEFSGLTPEQRGHNRPRAHPEASVRLHSADVEAQSRPSKAPPTCPIRPPTRAIPRLPKSTTTDHATDQCTGAYALSYSRRFAHTQPVVERAQKGAATPVGTSEQSSDACRLRGRVAEATRNFLFERSPFPSSARRSYGTVGAVPDPV